MKVPERYRHNLPEVLAAKLKPWKGRRVCYRTFRLVPT
jgi:hypothetical protein